MKEIGGFFELELKKGSHFHDKALKLNTGRNCLEYVLKTRDYKTIYIPFYSCDAIIEPIKKLGLSQKFYEIDDSLIPVFDKDLKDNEVLLVTNYFGMKDKDIIDISSKFKNLIVDNSQAFYSLPLKNTDTFYSPRKFFGVPDGGYLYTINQHNLDLEPDFSIERFKHLVGRIDNNAEMYFDFFKKCEISLAEQPIKMMSKSTQRILESIDYSDIAEKRKRNFNYLHNALYKYNQLKFEYAIDSVPMVYPLLTKDGINLRQELLKNKIFVATYWPNIKNQVHQNSIEYKLATQLIPLPIDQRYQLCDMDYILSIINYN